jgi:hypothetical protein
MFDLTYFKNVYKYFIDMFIYSAKVLIIYLVSFILVFINFFMNMISYQTFLLVVFYLFINYARNELAFK